MGFSKSQEIQQNTNEELYFDNEFDEDNIYEEISNIPNQPMIRNDDKEYYTTTEFKFTRNSPRNRSSNFHSDDVEIADYSNVHDIHEIKNEYEYGEVINDDYDNIKLNHQKFSPSYETSNKNEQMYAKIEKRLPSLSYKVKNGGKYNNQCIFCQEYFLDKSALGNHIRINHTAFTLSHIYALQCYNVNSK